MEKMGYAVSPIGEPSIEDAAQHLSSGQLKENRHGPVPPEPFEYFWQGLLTTKDFAIGKDEVHCFHAIIPFHIRKPPVQCFRLARQHLEGTFLLVFSDPLHG